MHAWKSRPVARWGQAGWHRLITILPTAGSWAPARLTWNHGVVENTRVDRWLWAVRLFKTRTAATDACRAGHVRINGAKVKPAAVVKVGDRVVARVGERQREVEVARIIEKRVGAAVAAECLIDHSPLPPPREVAPPVAQRDRGSGRPSKRERRQLDRLRGRRGR